LELDAHLKESATIIEQERARCRLLEEEVSVALKTQLDELTLELNEIVQNEKQRLGKLYETAFVKQQEFHQQALDIQKQKKKLPS
jgi:hypothetical protein